MMNKKAVVELKQIKKSFPGVIALKGFDFTIYEHEILGLVGENGAGKTTLVKLLNGLFHADEGEYFLRGKKSTIKDPLDAIKEGVGMVFQEGCTLPNLTVAENLFLCHEDVFRKNGFLQTKKMNQAAKELTKEMGLFVAPTTICNHLTPAQRQMVEISRLLWLSKLYGKENPILILDEPTTVLLEKEVDNLFTILKEVKKQASIILISHRLEEIIENSDRIAIFKDGEFITEMVQAEADIEKIEQLMVGRELAEEHYRESEQRIPEEEVFLEVKDLSLNKFFEPISFKVHKGEIVSLVGLIGSGKEELCQCIAGTMKADQGEISILGKPVKIDSPKDAIRYKLGYIPIDRRKQGLAVDMDLVENINMLVFERLKKYGLLNRKKELENAKKWSKETQVKAPSMRSKCANLSGGNQQKVVISKWLSAESQFLILDHPTRGIDVGAKDEIYHRMRELSKEGKSLLIMCDTLEEDIGLSNRMLIMKDGLLVEEVQCPSDAKPAPVDVIASIV
jgi:ribose transport system ATP-binding protein